MKSKRFSEEQIIAVLKESEAGAKTKDLCRRHGISEATFYNWKAKYAGMTVSQARREAVTVLMAERDFGVTRACGLVRISRSLYRYRSCRSDGGSVRARIEE